MINKSEVDQTQITSRFKHRLCVTRSLTVNPSGAFRHYRLYKHRGLGHRQPAVVTGGPALMGGVAIKDGLTVPDMAMRVGGAVAVGVWQEEVIVHRDSTR